MTKEKAKKISLNTQFQKYEDKVNNGFTKVKIFVDTHEQIANGTHFSRELLESKMSKLSYLPIVAEFKEDNNDFGTHGGKVELSDDGFDFIETTRPYGVIIEGSGKFETIKKPNGEECEYVTCLGYVWSERYPELNVLFEGKPNNQSMEINVFKGNDDDGIFEITDFEYSALCILGKNVVPAFDLAKVETNFARLDFKSQYSEMLQELGKSLNKEQEVDKMAKGKFEKQEDKVIEDSKVEEKTIEGTPKEEGKEDDFSKKEKDYEDGIKALTDKCLNYEKEIEKYKAMEKEYEELKSFKDNIDKEAKKEKIDVLFAKVEKYMDKDMEDLKEKAIDMDFEKLEKSLYSLVGKKMIEEKFSLSDSNVKKDIIDMSVEDNSVEVNTGKPYDSILKKYINK